MIVLLVPGLSRYELHIHLPYKALPQHIVDLFIRFPFRPVVLSPARRRLHIASIFLHNVQAACKYVTTVSARVRGYAYFGLHLDLAQALRWPNYRCVSSQ